VQFIVSSVHFHRAQVLGGVAGLQVDRAHERRALHGCKSTSRKCGIIDINVFFSLLLPLNIIKSSPRRN
jgi:hypothetical protein